MAATGAAPATRCRSVANPAERRPALHCRGPASTGAQPRRWATTGRMATIVACGGGPVRRHRCEGGATPPSRSGEEVHMKWVTRAGVKVDRVACPWLIRHFVDPDAEFLFVEPKQVMMIAAAEDATP